MDVEVLNNISFDTDSETVLQSLRLHRRNRQIEEMVQELLDEAHAVARPKAVYRVSFVENRGEDTVDIDGIRFTNGVLRKNLDCVHRVFPYIATCGAELDEISIPASDVMKIFCLDVIKTFALGAALKFLSEHIQQEYSLGQASHMNPGELDWSITQQKLLFSLFDNTEKLIGVSLTASNMMRPLKSRSGIYFPNETGYASCQLCLEKRCPGRKAAYNPKLARELMGSSNR